VNGEDHTETLRWGDEVMSTANMATRPLVSPFTGETAIQRMRLPEGGWNPSDPERVALACAVDLRRRNRSEFVR
jgi:nuclear transport factor 2 (NTF2) superfamily protein